ncbi:MAG: DUF1592 domain-containing protein [Kofleriaceae bacterium]|nr:MAG: DUF1592 domain-containing protein [Kofleriaceae bacterium]MBZ0234216.1 DUF1592 domain-containing protein [Kofleriaceae bacterium]
MHATKLPRAVLLVCAAAACGGETGTEDPGRITLHRLNNAEYNNTVRDLLGTELRPADAFPADDRGYGFDNVADVLRLSPLLVELYETAAEELINDTLRIDTQTASQMFEVMGSTQSGNALNGGWLFFSNGTATINVPIAAAGQYKVTVRAYGQQAGPDPARLSIEVSGQTPVVRDVTAVQAAPADHEAMFPLAQGNAQIIVGFVNDFYDEANNADRNLWVDHVIVEGPIGAPPVDEGRRAAVLICPELDDRTCQTSILRAFARRAWRRPPTDAEVQALVSLVDVAIGEGDTAEKGIRLALQAVLVSPHFVYKVELDPSPGSKEPHPLTDWELATRLSYFLWSTMPDAELFAAAEQGLLQDRAELERQVRRMLADPRAVALIDNFAGQWLFTRALGDQDPDYMLFPEYDDDLEAAMRAETRRYFQAFLDEDIPMDQFLVADFTYVNDRLAEHYGLPPVGGDELVRVSLADSPRRGFLMQGSFLRVTSRPKRTSPVLRGKWILDNLLCLPPRPPPPGVEGFPDDMTATGSIRDRLEQHKANPVCASCHSVMDPLGFGLDNFDAIGRYRTEDAGFAIDASGTFGDAARFDGPTEMVALLAAEPQVYRCLVEKLYTYTGRSPYRIEATEHIDLVTKRFIDNGYLLEELLVDIVTSDFFVSRRGEP